MQKTYLFMLIAGLIGIVLHAVVEIKKIDKRTPALSYMEILQVYFKSQGISFVMSLMVVLTAMFLVSEYLNLKDSDSNPTPGNVAQLIQYRLSSFIKTTFFVVGYFAESLLNLFSGTVEKKIQQKANEAGINTNGDT